MVDGSADRQELATAYVGTYLLVYTLSFKDLQHWRCRTSQCQTAGINTWDLAEVDFCADMAALLSVHLLAGFDNTVGT